MTREEIKNTPEIVDFMIDKSVIADSRMKLHKRIEELCKLAIKAIEQEPNRQIEDYENEIEDLHNRLDIAEYDKERLREEVTNLEAKIKVLEQEPCEDAISRQAVEDAIAETIVNGESLGYAIAQEIVSDLPSVNPQEPKTGHWIKISPADIFECSECGQNVMTDDICAYRYCHGCGAKMVESEGKE